MPVEPYAFIAGGGTGGHVYPALAIADAVVARGHSKESIHFVGSSRALEARVVPDAGYTITLLPGRGIERRVSVASALAVCGLVVALMRALILLARRRPKVVVSVGGYAAAPCALAAVIMRVPLVLAESNAVPGAANRLVSRFARASAVAWPGTPLERATVTGNPVRPEICSVDRSPGARKAAKKALGIPPERVLVVAFGGSLGARRINAAMAELAALWSERPDIAVYHIVGRRDWSKQGSGYSKADADEASQGLWYRAVEYEEKMAAVYSAADVVVSRSGATTSAELAVAGVPAILVPLPNAPGDHQTANARALSASGGAELLADEECSGESLRAVLEPLVSDRTRLDEMGVAIKTLGIPDAAGRVASIIESQAS